MDFSKMTLKEKVLQTFIVTIREINKHGEPKEFFEKYPVGGMYYSYLKGSEGTVEVGTGLNPARLAECRAASKLPLFVCADGTAMRGQTVSTSAEAVGSIQTEEAAYNYGKLLGMQMNDNTVDWILMPIVDLLYSHEMPLFAVSNDPETTAKLNRAIIRGIQEQGVCATAKHFPGIGTCNINMHFGPGQNVLSYDEWMKTYGYVYKEAFKENLASVMTTHMTFRAYDDEGENGYYPIATYSSKLTTDLLKGELGFEGAVVTDALIMGGMATGNLIEETVQSFKAGADFLLWPPVEAADRIVEALESGEIPMSRLDDALERINKMRTFRENALANHTYDEPSADFVNKTSENMIKNGICLLRNDIDMIPLNPENYKNILIVDVTDESDNGSSKLLQDELKSRGIETEIQRDIYDVPSRVCWQDDLDELQSGYDLVIFNVNTSYATTWNVPFMLIWASHLFDKKKKLIINYGSPFFAGTYFPEDPTFIEVNNGPSKTSVKAVADRILGIEEFTGKSVLI